MHIRRIEFESWPRPSGSPYGPAGSWLPALLLLLWLAALALAIACSPPATLELATQLNC